MSTSINKYGLRRNIPAKVKRDVRLRCNFGCVICGNPIVQYHHFDPPFPEARLHDSEKIALLCTKCHGEVENGIIPHSLFLKYNHSPKARLHGIAGWSPSAYIWPGIKIGTDTFFPGCKIKDYCGLSLKVEAPEQAGSPARITLHIRLDKNYGDCSLSIVRNEVRISAKNFDVKFEGSRLFIRPTNEHRLIELDFAGDQITLTKYRLTLKNNMVKVSNSKVIYGSTKTTVA